MKTSIIEVVYMKDFLADVGLYAIFAAVSFMIKIYYDYHS